MKIVDTEFEGLKIIEPSIYEDERGYFFESFNLKKVNQENIYYDFVQDNESKSKKAVVRGFHYQKAPFAQAKLVRVIQGSVQDVVIDLRQGSATYGSAFSIILSADNKKQLLIPRGFAHAFLSLEDDTIFAYKCDNYYSKEHECGIHLLNQNIFDSWELASEKFIISEKDLSLPSFEDAYKFK